jgi:hypothetical protein
MIIAAYAVSASTPYEKPLPDRVDYLLKADYSQYHSRKASL